MRPLPLVVAVGLLLFAGVALLSFRNPAVQAVAKKPQLSAERTGQPAGESKIVNQPGGPATAELSTNPAQTERLAAPVAAFDATQQAVEQAPELSEGPIATQVVSSAGRVSLAPNALGLFPRVNIALEEKVEVSVVYARRGVAG